MSYNNTLDLNIGRRCLDNWHSHHAVRELIANAIDEHTFSKIKKPIEIKSNQRTFEIIDFGRGLRQDHFIVQTNNTKMSNTNYIGQFGIGLKDSLGVLCRDNISVTIFTKEYKFKPEYKNKLETNRDTLHINVTKNTEKNINYGTKIVLDIDKRSIEKAKNYFLDYSSVKYDTLYKSYKSCDAILQYDKKQIIYVNGMKTCETSDLYFSYNIKKTTDLLIHFNRDRGDKNIYYQIFKKKIHEILENIDIFPEDTIEDKSINKLRNNIIEILQKKKLKEFNKKSIIIDLLKQFNNTDKYIFIDIKDKEKIKNKKYRNKIKELNRTILFLSDGVKNKLNNGAGINKIKNIKELCNFKINNYDKKLFTLESPEMFPPSVKIELIKRITELLNSIKEELHINIPKKVENILINIEIIDAEDNNDDNDNDTDTDNENENENDKNENENDKNGGNDNNDENDNNNDNVDNDDNYNSCDDNSDTDNNSNNIPANNSEDDLDMRNDDKEYYFDDDTFKIKLSLLNDDTRKNELKAIIFSYILENIKSNERIKILKGLITNSSSGSGSGSGTMSWFSNILRR